MFQLKRSSYITPAEESFLKDKKIGNDYNSSARFMLNPSIKLNKRTSCDKRHYILMP